jgi:hypothetical protein
MLLPISICVAVTYGMVYSPHYCILRYVSSSLVDVYDVELGTRHQFTSAKRYYPIRAEGPDSHDGKYQARLIRSKPGSISYRLEVIEIATNKILLSVENAAQMPLNYADLIYDIDWSPNDQYIMLRERSIPASGFLRVYGVHNSERYEKKGGYSEFDWSPDSQELVINDVSLKHPTISFWRFNASEIDNNSRFTNSIIHDLAWSPNGKLVASVVSGRDKSNLVPSYELVISSPYQGILARISIEADQITSIDPHSIQWTSDSRFIYLENSLYRVEKEGIKLIPLEFLTFNQPIQWFDDKIVYRDDHNNLVAYDPAKDKYHTIQEHVLDFPRRIGNTNEFYVNYAENEHYILARINLAHGSSVPIFKNPTQFSVSNPILRFGNIFLHVTWTKAGDPSYTHRLTILKNDKPTMVNYLFKGELSFSLWEDNLGTYTEEYLENGSRKVEIGIVNPETGDVQILFHATTRINVSGFLDNRLLFFLGKGGVIAVYDKARKKLYRMDEVENWWDISAFPDDGLLIKRTIRPYNTGASYSLDLLKGGQVITLLSGMVKLSGVYGADDHNQFVVHSTEWRGGPFSQFLLYDRNLNLLKTIPAGGFIESEALRLMLCQIFTDDIVGVMTYP